MDRPVIIHSLIDARAAVTAAAELGVPLTLASAPGAAGYAGVAWFGELIATACAEHPDVVVTAVLDCGDAPGRVMEAVRWCAVPSRPRLVLRFIGDDALAGPLQDIADAAGLRLIRDLPPALDLAGAADPAAACHGWLAGVAAGS
jgi:hypothetical protein